MSNQCSICTADNCDELEELGQLALDGLISWREAQRRGALNHYRKLQNHMDRHYVAPLDEELNSFDLEWREEVLEAKRLLLEKVKLSPPEVRPMYLAAIHNLDKIHETKGSQGIMVSALKTATEMTGMKMEQQLMVQFAQAAFDMTPAATAELSAAPVDELQKLRDVLAREPEVAIEATAEEVEP